MSAFISQISTCHQLLHPQVLQLLIKLFETEHSQLDVMEQVCYINNSLQKWLICSFLKMFYLARNRFF